MDHKGHLVHIDFGFMFSNSPGSINFESAPFKLTQDYMDIMGGPNSQMFEYFKSLLTKAFFTVRKHLPDIISMIEIMFKDSQFPCFKGGRAIFEEIEKRCSPRYNVGENQQNEFQELVDRIIAGSVDKVFLSLFISIEEPPLEEVGKSPLFSLGEVLLELVNRSGIGYALHVPTRVGGDYDLVWVKIQR